MGSRVVAWIAAAALASPLTAVAGDPVPVQRPHGAATVEPTPVEPTPVAPTPAPPTPVEPTPAEPTPPVADASIEAAEAPVEAPPEGDVVPPAVPKGRIAGVVLDTEQAGIGVPDVNITAVCPCLPEPIGMHSDYDGRFEIDDLPPGIYTLFFDRGGRHTKRVVSLADGQRAKLSVEVAPPTESAVLERREKTERRAGTMIAVGSVGALAGFVMVIAAGVEANKPPCMFGLDDCSNAPRPDVAKGLGIGGALALAGGATLILVGALSRRRVRAAMAADTRSAALVVSGRF